MSSDVEKKHRHRLMSDAKAMYSTLLQDTIEGRVTAQTVEDAWEATLAELVRDAEVFDEGLFLAGRHMADKVTSADDSPDNPQIKKAAAEKKPPSDLPPPPGTKAISIRVPNRVIHAFKKIAEKKGVAYQQLMNRALAEWEAKELETSV